MAVTVTLVAGVERDLETVLRAAGMRLTVIGDGDLPGLAQPGARLPDVLVLDLRGRTHLPQPLASLKRQHPATGILIVASSLDPALMLEAMRAGVNECVADPLTQGDLEAAVARIVAQRPGVAGQVFAFVGAKGGVGATTIAVNVATALAKVATAGTLLIDLHLAYGDATVYLEVEPRFSIVDALENIHRLDAAYFRGLVVRTKPGPDVLASSDRPVTGHPDGHRIRTLIEFASSHYRYIVLDVPRSAALMVDALETVSKIVVVANQELPTVRNASRLAAALWQRYGKDKVAVVVNRLDRTAEIGAEDVARTVGLPVRHVFPSEYRPALESLNRGSPVVLGNHKELANSFKQFARELAGIVGDRPGASERPVGLLGRLTGSR